MSGDEQMRPANPGVKLTYDDYVLFPDDGQRHELIDGEHVVLTTPLLPGLSLPLSKIFED